MDSEDGKDQVVEEGTPPKDSNSSVEPNSEAAISVGSDRIDRELPQNSHNTQTHSELTLNNDRPSIVNMEDGIPAQSTVNSNEAAQDCCILVPESAYALPKRKRFNLLGCLNNRDNPHGIVKPEDSNSFPPRSTRRIGDHYVGDVTLNLTEFLTYAERNHCDIFFPASSENRSLNTNLPRIGTGRPSGFSRANPTFSVAELLDYSAIRIMNERRRPSRNSVLAPNMYHPGEDIRPPVVDFNAPPPYEMPMKLPTYEEVQREKALEGELLPSADMPNADANSSRTLSFLAIDADMGTNVDPESKLLGSDFMFAVAFVLALVFNWIGFLLLMCFCHTVASRYGALSGFGLSLAKWTIIVKNSMEAPIHNAWLWWLITTFGLLICVRSLFQYINIKRGWRLMSAATQERFLFFY